MKSYSLFNKIFFALYILSRPRLIILSLKRHVYLPTFVQFEWLTKYKVETIIDIGAHKAKVAHPLHLMFPSAKIYAFEPNTSLHQIIKDKINSKVLTLESYAASNKTGNQDIFLAEDTSLTTILPFLTPGIRNGIKVKTTKRKIKTITLDEYFKDKNITKNILLKIDTEGSEGMVLKGATNILSNVSIIHIETYFQKMYKGQMLFEEIYDFLTNQGFKYIGISPESYFYPNFDLPVVTNSVFINTKLIHS